MADISPVEFKARLQTGLNAKLDTKEMLKQIDKILDHALKVAQGNLKMLIDTTRHHKEWTKEMYDAAEASYEKIKEGDEDSDNLFMKMRQAAISIEKSEITAKNLSATYTIAFNGDGFRSGLAAEIIDRLKELKTVDDYAKCSETTPLGKEIVKLVKPITDARNKILNDLPLAQADRDRIAEYSKRLESFIETANKVMQGERAEKSKFVLAAGEIMTRMGKRGTAPDEALWGMYAQLEGKIERSRQNMSVLGNRAVLEQSRDGFSGEGEKRRKDLSGKIRTLLVDLQAMRTIHGKRSYSKKLLPSLEKNATELTTEFKMQQARFLETEKMYHNRLQELPA